MTQMTIRVAGLFALFSLFMAGEAAAAVCTSKASGSWASAATWTCIGTPVVTIPGSADSAVIASPNTVSLVGSVPVTNLTVNSGGTLNVAGFTLTVSGNLTNNGTISGTAGNGLVGMTGNAAVVSGTGTISNVYLYFSGTGPSIATGAAQTFSGASRLYAGRTSGGTAVAGSVLTINGTINSTVPTATTNFLRLYANSTVIGTTGVINAAVSAVAYYTATASVTNNGSVNVNVITQNAGTNSWTQGANSSLTVSAVSTVGTLNASATGNTVTYTAPATPIAPSGNTYYNLAGSGVTCPIAFTVLGSSPCLVVPGSGSVTSGPTSCSSGGGTGTIAWTPSPTANANTNDNVLYATAGLVRGQTTRYLNCTGFDFSAIPADTTITGITVYVDRKASRATRIRDAFVYLSKAGVISTAFNGATATSYTTADVEEAHGGTGNLWGTTWSPAEVASNFGVAFAATNYSTTDTTLRTVSVDSIRVKIDYQKYPFHHIRIEHDGAGTTCAPETITLRACGDAACSTSYTATDVIGINLAPTGAGYTWTPANPQSIFATNGGVNEGVALARTTAGTATLAITGTPSPVPTNAFECYNTSTGTSGNCNLVFASNVFAFDILHHAAGTRQVATLTDCSARFANRTRSVKFWSTYTNPATGTLQGKVVAGAGNTNCTTGYSALATSSATPTALSLTFNANALPQATFSLCYPDVGEMRLDARYDGSPATGDNGVVILGNDNFVAKPDHFDVTGIVRTSDNFANPAVTPTPANPENTTKFVKAGVATEATTQFTATVTAKNAQGTTAPNFGREAVPEGVVLTAAVVEPAGGSNGLLTCKGSATDCVVPGGAANFTGGATTITDLAWSEVGILKVLPKVADADYLGTGGVATPTYSPNIGRFYPHHFGVTHGTIDNRADWCDGGVLVSDGTTVCASPAFTYIGEPMNASFILSALNFSGSVTQNYTGAFAKLNPLAADNTLVFGAVDGEGGATPTNLTARLDTSQVVAGGTGSFASGIATISVPIAITRGVAPDGPYAALDIGIAPADSDGVATVLDLDINGDAVADRTQVNSAVTDVRYGRIKLSNAHGSELLPLPLTATVQYWDGSGWVLNNADTVTTLLASDFALAFPAGTASKPNNLAACETALTVAGGSPMFALNLSKPGNGNNGWTNLTLNLGAVAAGNQCTVVGGAGAAATTTNQPWLQFPVGANPVARATFGVMGGNGAMKANGMREGNEFIYLRENY